MKFSDEYNVGGNVKSVGQYKEIAESVIRRNLVSFSVLLLLTKTKAIKNKLIEIKLK